MRNISLTYNASESTALRCQNRRVPVVVSISQLTYAQPQSGVATTAAAALAQTPMPGVGTCVWYRCCTASPLGPVMASVQCVTKARDQSCELGRGQHSAATTCLQKLVWHNPRAEGPHFNT